MAVTTFFLSRVRFRTRSGSGARASGPSTSAFSSFTSSKTTACFRLRAKALERSRGHPTPNKIELKTNGQLTPSTAAEVSTEKAGSQEQLITRRMWDELDDRKAAILNELWVNLGYLPLTMHWSSTTGLISDGWVGLFGTIAGLAGLRSGWKNSAAPPVPPPVAS